MSETSPWHARRMQTALEQIRDIAAGSRTANSLPHIERIAAGAIEMAKPVDDHHAYKPHRKYPWFCDLCGYPAHENLKHT